MRLGAQHYILLSERDAVLEVVKETKALLASQAARTAQMTQAPQPQYSLKDLTLHSSQSRSIAAKAAALAQSTAPILVIAGPAGTGKRTVANAIQCTRSTRTHTLTIDAALFCHPWASLYDASLDAAAEKVLGKDLSVILLHPEADNGDCLAALGEQRDRIWGSPHAADNASHLLVITEDIRHARAWCRVADAEMLLLPSLKERVEDIAPLVGRIIAEVEQRTGSRYRTISTEIRKALAAMDWPGNIQQLRAALTDAVCASRYSEQPIEELIEDARQRWIEGSKLQSEQEPLEPHALSLILERYGFRYNLAAAAAGVSVHTLRHAIHHLKRGEYE